jgi:hypothetical protein
MRGRSSQVTYRKYGCFPMLCPARHAAKTGTTVFAVSLRWQTADLSVLPLIPIRILPHTAPRVRIGRNQLRHGFSQPTLFV